MRGGDERSGSLFSYVDLEARVGKDHALRTIRGVVNEALAALSGEFSALYSQSGRPSIPPEKLLRAMLLQAFYSIRSERQLMERLEFDLLFRWFVGIGVDDEAWDHSTFSKNRERLLEGDIAAKLLSAVLSQPRVKRLLSTDHFSVDGTLIEAWASMKSFRPKNLSSDEDPSNGSGEPPTPGEPRGGFSWPEALQRDARFDDRSASAALSQGTGQGSQALLHGPCADGESQRPRRRRLLDRGKRPCRADRCAPYDRAARGSAATHHARRRQGL
jgi:transposase